MPLGHGGASSSPSSHFPTDDDDDNFLSFDPNDLDSYFGNGPTLGSELPSGSGENSNYFSDDDFLNFHPNGSEVGHENDPPAWSSEDESDGSKNHQTPGDDHPLSPGNAQVYGHVATAKPVQTISSRHSIQTATHRTADEVAANEALAASYFGLHPTIVSTSSFHNSSSSTSRTSSRSSSATTSNTSATSRDPESSTGTPTRTPDPSTTFSMPTPTTTADPDDPDDEENSNEDPSKPAEDAAEAVENGVGDAAGAAGAAAGGAAGAGGSLFGGIGSALGGLVGAGAGVAAGVGAGAAAGHHNDKPADPVTIVSNVATPNPTPETQAQNFGATTGPNTSIPIVPETPETAGLNLSIPQSLQPTRSNQSVLEHPELLNASYPDVFNTSHHIDPLYNATIPTLPFEPLHNASAHSNPFNTSHHVHPLHNETTPRLPFEPLHNTTLHPSNSSHHIYPLHTHPHRNSTHLRSPPALLNITSKPHLTTGHHNQTISHPNSTRKHDIPPMLQNALNHTKSLFNSTRHSGLPIGPPKHLNASHPVHTGPLRNPTIHAPAGKVSSSPHVSTLTPSQNSFCNSFAEPHYSALTNISDAPSAAIQTTCGGPISTKTFGSLLLAIYEEVHGNKIDFPMTGQAFKYHKEVGGVTFDYTGVTTGLAGAIGAWNLLKPTVNYYFLLWHEGVANAALSWISKTVPDHLGPGHARALGKPVALGSPVVKVTICQKGSKCPESSGAGP